MPSSQHLRRTGRRLNCALLAVLFPVVAAVMAMSPATQAADAAESLDAAVRKPYNIPAGPLGRSLAMFAMGTGVALSFDPALTEGRSGPALIGSFSAREGFGRLLAGSGLELVRAPNGAYSLRPLPPKAAVPAAPIAQGEQQLPEVKVRASSEQQQGKLPEPYPGGQVARGARIGVLGNADLMDVPMSVVAFTSEFRDNIQALSVSDMLKYSVSAQTPQAGAVPTTDVIYVRGFNVGTYDGTFDGLPGLLGRMPPVEALERVELLLGANAFANGQPSSVGGNINLVPKRAGEEPLFRVGVNYRTESIVGTTVDASTRFGPDKAFGLRVNASFAEGNTELADGRRKTMSRALAFDYRGSSTRFTFDYMGNDRRLPAEAWFVVDPGVAVPDAGRASRDFRQPWARYKDVWDAAVARGEWDFAPKWTLSAAYGRMWTKVERKSQVSEVIADDGSMIDAFGGTLGHSKQRRVADASEVQVRGEFVTGPLTHRARLGFAQFGDKSAFAGAFSPVFVPFASNIYSPTDYPEPDLGPLDMPSQFDSRTRNSTFFIGDEIRMFNDRLRLMLGARQVQYKTEYYNFATGSWDGDPAIRKWSPAYGVLFKVLPRVSLYANQLEALDPGYVVQPPATNAGTILPPLPAKQREFGAKAEFGKLGFTAALFEIDKPSYFLNPVTGVEGSNGRQVNRGLELSLFGEAARGLRLYTSATFLDPKMEKTPGGTLDGKVAVSAARVMANAYADWDVPGVAGLALLGGVSHSGRVYNDEPNTQPLEPWTRIDVGLRYRSVVFGRSTVLRLTVDNVTDKKYFVSERGTIYFAPARTIGVAMTMDL